MQQKLIVTLWKAQLLNFPKQDSVYCRLTYNSQQRNSKSTSHEHNLTWKETFIMPLARKDFPLKLQFIGIKPNQQIHFAKDNVLESLSFGKAIVTITLENAQHGSLPCKLDILDQHDQPVGKIFIEYEVIKTEITYTVDKQLDYFYLLKLTNFKVKFVRHLRKTPRFYLRCHVEGRTHREDLPFEEDDSGCFVYNYPVKLYLKKQLEMELQLLVGEEASSVDYQTESSFHESVTSEKKTNKSSINKKQKNTLDLAKDKITALMDLNFKKDAKVQRKLPLTTLLKSQKREIGIIDFQAEAFFRTKEELLQLEEQKRGLHIEPSKSTQRKKTVVKPTNGVIIVNSILGKLQLFNQLIIEGRNMSIELTLGKQTQQSSILERPGKQLIFIDTFVFKRTWEETVKLTVNIHAANNQKIPTFFAQVNLRELFEIGRYISKKVKLKDQNKNYSGELVLDMVYREEERKSPSLKQSMASIPEVLKEQEAIQLKAKLKRDQIEQRIRKRQQEKERTRQLNSMSTLSVLQQNDIILPPLKSYSRMQTISPNKPEKFRAANLFNVNGCIKFSKSPRFQSAQKPGYESYTYVHDSDFDPRKKRGASIGAGSKYDFTKPLAKNPGVGRYQIQSLWDKYN